jgi:hypothetical protein
MRMSGEDLLRGLPLPAAPLSADVFGHVHCSAMMALAWAGVTGVPSVSQTT